MCLCICIGIGVGVRESSGEVQLEQKRVLYDPSLYCDFEVTSVVFTS